MKLFKRRRTHKRAMGGAAVGVVVATALVAQMSMVSNASWNDSEWVNSGPVSTVACTDQEGAFATRGEGRALSGSLLGIDLDTLLEAERVEVTNDGSRAVASAGQPVNGLTDAFADPLSVNALSAIQLPLNGILELPTNNSTGVVGQFGQAVNTGLAFGSSGFITDSGGIDLRDGQVGGYPNLATLKLSSLLNSSLLGDIGLGNTLAGVADLELEVGAVAGEASLDTCSQIWQGSSQARAQGAAAGAASDIIAGLDRRYLTASADLSFKSGTVGALVTGINGTLNGLQGTINGLIGQQSVTTSIVNAVAALLNGVLGLLGLGKIGVEHLSATVSLTSVQQLLTSTFGDSAGVLTINPTDGTIRISTAALLSEAYGTSHGNTLNSLAPNTDLLGDPAIVTTLTSALTSALGDWLGLIETTLLEQINAISVSARVTIEVKALLPVATITASVDGSLGDLLAGTVKAQTSVKVLGLLDLGLLNPILNALVNGLGKSIGDILKPLFTTVHVLPATVTALVNPIIALVSRLYTGLFLSNILSITVNAQNQPASGSPPPPDWVSGRPTAPPDHQYEVAALRIGVLDGLGPNSVRLYLGRASVGPGCSPSNAAQQGSPCSGY